MPSRPKGPGQIVAHFKSQLSCPQLTIVICPKSRIVIEYLSKKKRKTALPNCQNKARRNHVVVINMKCITPENGLLFVSYLLPFYSDIVVKYRC